MVIAGMPRDRPWCLNNVFALRFRFLYPQRTPLVQRFRLLNVLTHCYLYLPLLSFSPLDVPLF